MGKIIDLTDQRFGKLIVVRTLGLDKHKKSLWLCRCECGAEIVASSNHLRRGALKSCGCAAHRESRTRLWNIWASMKGRCYTPSSSGYANYGGRGIKVCEEWRESYTAFRDWALSNGYQDELTIERKDTNGDYEPQNCCWATTREQNRNKRNSRHLEFNGECYTVAEWAKKLGIRTGTLHDRLYRSHWSIERALTEPIRGRRND